MRGFFHCCLRWARSVSPKGNLWFWALFIPFIGNFLAMAGDRAYEVILNLSALGVASLIAIWVSYMMRSYFDDDVEFLIMRDMVNKLSDNKNLEVRSGLILSRTLMLAASWLSRAIVMVGFLWAIVIAFRGGRFI